MFKGLTGYFKIRIMIFLLQQKKKNGNLDLLHEIFISSAEQCTLFI